MGKYCVKFLKEKKEFMAPEGMTVLEAQRAAGLVPDAPCGGQGKCKKCKVIINGEPALACQTKITSDILVNTEIEDDRKEQILISGLQREVSLMPGPIPADVEFPLLAAIDLGSTTIVGYLLDGKTGCQTAVKSILNPQRQYGADVVMRSSYAIEKGADILSGCVRRAINEMLREMANESGKRQEDIVRIIMVGNSCMHHLFLGISTESLVLAPYEPKVKKAVQVKASECGIYAHPQAQICWLPNIGGFVGADTVGCILASDLEKREEITLLVDIGTNGEMVLGNKEGLAACSTAAGPAFEGAKITCGMRGNTGAIDRVFLEDGKIKYHVIGDVEPTGICGSGLLDAAACMLETGLLDESGRLEETYYFTQNVFINQKDVRELQLAKAAIASGVLLLCKHKGISVEDIQELMLAGAFGNYLNPASACAIGLLPPELSGRIKSIGNAAGVGAQIAALNFQEYERSSYLAESVEFLELALDPDFQDTYVDQLMFGPEEE